MPQQPPSWFTQGLLTLNDAYSDFTIITPTRTHAVHRLILHLRSTYFASLFPLFPLQASHHHIITNHPPDAVSAMLKFFYTSTYYAPAKTSYPLRLHAEVFDLGREYGCAELMEAAIEKFERSLCWERWGLEDLISAVECLDRVGIEGFGGLRKKVTGAMRGRYEEIKEEREFLEWGRRRGSWYREVLAGVLVEEVSRPWGQVR